MSERRTTIFDGTSRQQPRPASGGGLDRRRALELLAAGLTAGLAACSSPDEEIVPYVNMPERLVPGTPLRFASTLPLSGYGRGVVCTSFEGRPTKVEGNPRHPGSQGSTDPFAEAAVLQLYDPDRSRTVRLQSEVSSWEAFVGAMLAQMQAHAGDGGAGLRLLTGRVTSPTLVRQIGEIRARFPQARWHRYEPVDDDNARRGARLAYGRTLTALPDLGRADVILALDADPLGVGPDQIRNARGFAERRTVRRDGAAMSRLYAVEPLMTLTGANADNRLALAPHAVGDLAVAVAAALGAGVDRPELAPVAAPLCRRCRARPAAAPGPRAGPGRPRPAARNPRARPLDQCQARGAGHADRAARPGPGGARRFAGRAAQRHAVGRGPTRW